MRAPLLIVVLFAACTVPQAYDDAGTAGGGAGGTAGGSAGGTAGGSAGGAAGGTAGGSAGGTAGGSAGGTAGGSAGGVAGGAGGGTATSGGFSLRFYGADQMNSRVKVRLDDPATVTAGPALDVGATDFTIDFWLKARGADNPNGAVACGNGQYSFISSNIIIDRDRHSQPRAWGIGLANGRVVFSVNTATGAYTGCGTTSVLDDAWHHVAVTRRLSDGRVEIFVDGARQSTGTGPAGDVSYPDDAVPSSSACPNGGSCAGSDPFLVFGAEKHGYGGISYNGLLDEVRVSTTLRYTGVSFPRPAAPHVSDSSTAGLFHFDTGSGTGALDSSSHATHGVLQPMTDWVAGGPFSSAQDRPPLDGGTALGAISFTANAAGSDDHGLLTALPAGFGAGELTLELWMKPDSTFSTGTCADGTAAQRSEWCTQDPAPYSSSDWWYKGNFLLDGHNNASFGDGTFSLQFYGGGRLRWQLGDQGAAGSGGVWGVQAHPASSTPSLLDGRWHHVACVRRWQAQTQAALELWVDGVLVDTEVSDVRTNLAAIWSSWSGFPIQQRGWFFGAEKQSAIGALAQYEDYKGLISELRFWNRALGAAELTAPAHARAVTGTEPGLAGWFRFSEGAGTQACDALQATRCISFVRPQQPFWR